MMAPQAVAEAMEYIIEHVSNAYSMTFWSTVDDPDVEMTRIATELGSVIGAATAVKLQCEQTGKPKTRGAGE